MTGAPQTQLPIVTKETGYAVCRELEQEENNEYILRLIERLTGVVTYFELSDEEKEQLKKAIEEGQFDDIENITTISLEQAETTETYVQSIAALLSGRTDV